ncbi:TonB-dependent receptor domain-containing protein [Moraxella sp. ZJ142]|uniref:TonB-dependent receptor domain-containing protein n=1 Tax=Moraxella marmotae TaxID=3344520 RepID=UPI0035D4CDB2
MLDTMVVTSQKTTRYQKGKDQQFDQNIVNFYKDKDEVERYKGVSPADLLSGVPGVYSSDARNNGAISPNVRGLQGEGRVPVVVDGTRSEFTVYRGYTGVNNRTYVDPNLISEVTAYKGATELKHGMPNAIGGAIVLNTIDAKDVIPEGKNWGVNVKYETNNNSVKPRYPNIPYGESYDTPENFWWMFEDANPNLYIPLKASGKNKFFDDYAFRLAVAGKSDLADIMLAYSKRQQGNYFSGKNNSDIYQTRFDNKNEEEGEVLHFAEFAPPNHEVPNTSNKNESFLLKNNWYLPNNQEVNVSYRHSDLEYGEIMNSRSTYADFVKRIFDYGPNANIGVQWTPAKIQQNVGRIDYKFNPEDNKWVNFKSGVWYSNTHSRNNSSGGPIAAPKITGAQYFTEILLKLVDKPGCLETFNAATKSDETSKLDPSACKLDVEDFASAKENVKNLIGYEEPDFGKQIINSAVHINKNKHFGVDLSNTMELHPTLNLTVGTNIHKEKLSGELAGKTGFCQTIGETGECIDGYDSGYIFPPKSGERHQYDAWFNFNWQPTDRLTLTAGGRWGRYSINDKQADEKIKSKEYYRADPVWRRVYTEDKLLTKADFDKMRELGLATDVAVTTWFDCHAYIDYLGGGYQKTRGGDQCTTFGNPVLKGEERYWYADSNGKFHKEDFPIKSTRDGHVISGGVEQVKRRSEDEKHEPFGTTRDKAFDPSFSISYLMTPYSRLYARYAQMTRFPSIYEHSSGFSEKLYRGNERAVFNRSFKPEQARNFEIGMVQDLTNWLPKVQTAQLKLNYYHNKIHNILDRDSDNQPLSFFTQYDRLSTRGLELQGQLDAGRIFADIGYSRLLENKVCDADAAHAIRYNDVYTNFDSQFQVPECYTGGFPNSYLRGLIPPKHTLTINLGTRLLEDKLILGTRFTYQSKPKKVEIYGNGVYGGGLNNGLDPYGWGAYHTFDAYADYQIKPNVKLSLIGTNLNNTYHPDALTRTAVPAPGRTIKLGVDMKF